jgi:hypothetical protein
MGHESVIPNASIPITASEMYLDTKASEYWTQLGWCRFALTVCEQRYRGLSLGRAAHEC